MPPPRRRRLDLGDDLVGDGGVGALAVHRSAQVVDDHRGAAPSQLQRIQTAQSPARSRDDRHLVGEIDHELTPFIVNARGAHRVR